MVALSRNLSTSIYRSQPFSGRARVLLHRRLPTLVALAAVTVGLTVTTSGPADAPAARAEAAGRTESTTRTESTARVDLVAQRAGRWLSGASGSEAANGTFGRWRGARVEIIGTWINDPAVYPFGRKIPGCGSCGELRSWTGPVDVAIAPAKWHGWAAEARGRNDAFWRATARNLAKARAGKGTTYVRPYYEFNGDWFRYSVRKGEEKKFVKAWERVARIFRAELPGVKMMLGTAASGHGKRISVAKAYPRGVDVLSIDYYNEWPFCRTKACFAKKIKTGGGVNSLERLRRLAAKKGDPVMISEWGNAGRRRHSRSGGGGESVAFMSAWHSWLGKHAGTGRGRVLGEIYFNIDGYDARFELRVRGRTTKVMPKTAARYRQLFDHT